MALKYDRNILGTLSKKYRVILVTGTNGKTTTASLISKILTDVGYSVIINSAGANLLSGITTLFIRHQMDMRKEFAVVEIDEATLPLYAEVARAEYILVTNIFKDQLDRYGETYSTFKKIREGIHEVANVKLVLNGDEPLFGNIRGNTLYYGFSEKPDSKLEGEKSNIEGKTCIICGEKYSYQFRTYNHLGKYLCPHCGYGRPSLSYHVSESQVQEDGHVKFMINDRVEIKTKLMGIYNIYNILGAFAIAREVGLGEQVIAQSVQSINPSYGRTELFEWAGKKIKLMLAKNPVSLDLVLGLPTPDNDYSCGCFILNDNSADGRDVSWIWDVDFENNMVEYTNLLVGGTRRFDMALRLSIAGYPKEKILILNDLLLFMGGGQDLEQITAGVDLLKNKKDLLKRILKLRDVGYMFAAPINCWGNLTSLQTEKKLKVRGY